MRGILIISFLVCSWFAYKYRQTIIDLPSTLKNKFGIALVDSTKTNIIPPKTEVKKTIEMEAPKIVMLSKPIFTVVNVTNAAKKKASVKKQVVYFKNIKNVKLKTKLKKDVPIIRTQNNYLLVLETQRMIIEARNIKLDIPKLNFPTVKTFNL